MINKLVSLTLLAFLIAVSYFYYQEMQKSIESKAALSRTTDEAEKYRKKFIELEESSKQSENERKQSAEILAKEKERCQQEVQKGAELQAAFDQSAGETTTCHKKITDLEGGIRLAENEKKQSLDALESEKKQSLDAFEKEKSARRNDLAKSGLLQEKETKIVDLEKTVANFQQRLSLSEAKVAELIEQAAQASKAAEASEAQANKRDADSKIQNAQYHKTLETLEALTREKEALIQQVAEKTEVLEALTREREVLMQQLAEKSERKIEIPNAEKKEGQIDLQQKINESLAIKPEILQERDARIADLEKTVMDFQQQLRLSEAKIAELIEQAKPAPKTAEPETETPASTEQSPLKAITQSATESERSKADIQKRLETLASEKEQEIRKVQAAHQGLVQNLKKEIEANSVTIEQYKEKLTIKMIDRILFSSGSVHINAGGLSVLKTIGNALRTSLTDRRISVEGHTDNAQIYNEKVKNLYPTNWELSTARAVKVVRYLQEYADIPPEKLHAVGFGEHRPIADNATLEGQAQNRRIEIVLTPSKNTQ